MLVLWGPFPERELHDRRVSTGRSILLAKALGASLPATRGGSWKQHASGVTE